MKISLYYNEKNIKWQVIGADEYKELKDRLNPKKFIPLHTNNLKIDVFKKGCWTSYTCSYTNDIIYVVVNEGKEQVFSCQKNIISLPIIAIGVLKGFDRPF